jgi:hypothetical protein
MPLYNPSRHEAMARWLPPSEHRHRITPQSGRNARQTIAVSIVRSRSMTVSVCSNSI